MYRKAFALVSLIALPPPAAEAQGIGQGYLDIPRYDSRSGGTVPSPHVIRPQPMPSEDFRIDGTITGPFGDRNQSAHEAWCRNNFPSYNPQDDTVERGDGPRTRCRSPFQ
jgi:hypothetical protein